MKINKLLIGFLVLAVTSLFTVSAGSEAKKDDLVVLSKDNVVVLSSEIRGESVGKVIAQVKALDSQPAGNLKNRFGLGGTKKPIYLFLNTPGGSIQAGLELIEALNGANRPIHTVILFAASMGFQITQNLGERHILKNGVLMSHRASGEFFGNFGGQRPSQLDSRYNLWISRMNELDTQTVKRTNGKQTLESYQKAYADELWMTGTQSVEGGYADNVVTVKCDESLDGVTTNTLSFFGLIITYDLDNCPINTSPMNVKVSVPSEEKEKTSPDKILEVKAKFLELFLNKQHSVVPMYW